MYRFPKSSLEGGVQLKPIRAVVFDLDGTLVEAKEWHYQALNEALGLFGGRISEEEHQNEFDGLSTRQKLTRLSELGRFPQHLSSLVMSVKQNRTLRLIRSRCYPTTEHLLLMQWLKARGIKIGVATNSIRATAEAMLSASQLSGYIDLLITNEDVRRPKPDPEIYEKATQILGLSAREILVVEDHEYGVSAAEKADCLVVKIGSPHEVRIPLIERELLGPERRH